VNYSYLIYGCVMANRGKTKNEIRKKHLRKLLKTIGKLLAKAAKLSLIVIRKAAKTSGRLLKAGWKAWRKSRKARWRRKIPLGSFSPEALVISIVVGAVIFAGFTIKRNVSCALANRVTNETIQERWRAVRKWCPAIMQASAANQLDPNLIAAVIWVESSGNPKAMSASGAVGLMQVMPRDGLGATYSCPDGPCFANRPTIAQLKNPSYNVAYGSQLLADNLERTDSLRDALRDYGPFDVGYEYADHILYIYEEIKR
jgi:soluble lytic murein transglycosylase-like protein